MAIGTGSHIDVTLKAAIGNSAMLTVFSYNVLELVGTPTAVNYGEAWWNHVKTTTRALQLSAFGDIFSSVVVRELNNPSGELGEFDIPTGERAGTRSAPAQSNGMPLFVAAGARLTVATRLTRPGQKRMYGLAEEDNVTGAMQSAYKALFTSWLNVITSPMTLGAPAAGVVLAPAVFKRDPSGTVVAAQVVTGYVINNNLTSQTTRKFGRGI